MIYIDGANVSMTNDKSRMESLIPHRQEIKGIGGSIWAEGRGTMLVQATKPDGELVTFSINNSYYAPDLPTSIVSGTRIRRSKIHLDGTMDILYRRVCGKREVLACLKTIYELLVIEGTAHSFTCTALCEHQNFSKAPSFQGSLDPWYLGLIFCLLRSFQA